MTVPPVSNTPEKIGIPKTVQAVNAGIAGGAILTAGLENGAKHQIAKGVKNTAENFDVDAFVKSSTKQNFALGAAGAVAIGLIT